ncbi:MAG: DUF2075 domain-containing protein [Acholeplasmatales bacterium]|jgi:DUF2075 family protein|nr:DUF2075 domain-containing protein [Acholeplasmataceae bacterium]MCK9233790.1 DUF2075 domain-containing protein [Acholeplasmataceae bacterium]MCK9289712.1 DUF2075 domain-containing protein [Acholeplasmataceae bacterium]MCK9428049.1 DUF2075 domain-containing protein [Acholeplasmataceae bacterium]MDY0115691.1 DUF2075 domain-containing protein [Acholeplasmatales bacterium]
MIVYTNTINEFNNDVVSGLIATKIQDKLIDSGYSHSSDSEFRSWENSLLHMQMVLNDNSVNQELHVAIEYNIPNTSKRVDFIVSGLDEHDKPKVVIVELKQWEKAERTSREDLVTTFIGGNIRPVTHPSYQAYSYAKTIESFNETVYKNNIKLIPSAFLHNYKEEYRKELDNYLYQDIVKVAPLFLQRDKLKLRDFITKNVKKSDQGKLLYQIDNGKIKPSKSLQDAISSMLEGNKEFYMIDEQKVAFSTVKKLVENAFKTDDKYTVIIEGGPGTGKSVIAINLLAEFKNRLVNYVTKNAAPRNVFFEKLKREKYKLNYINNLFKGSGAYVNTKKNEYDLLIVDEAHRLNERSGLFAHRGENQIKEIINAAKVSVFFIDEDQKVTTKDFGSVEEIKKQAKLLNSQLFYGEDYQLVSQFRCNGSDGYLAFLDDVLGIRKTANYDGFEMDYDIKVFDDLILMKENLKKLNEINNKTRMVAGYTYDWVTKKNPNVDEYDIVLGEFKAKWNFSNTKTWAIDESSFDEVGCIHTSQGLEFDYIGVIIGKDLIYRNNKVITDFTKRAKTDYSLRGIKTNENYQLADTIIRNTYKTLMSRGQKGCYVYCEDKELSNYLRKRIHGNQ